MTWRRNQKRTGTGTGTGERPESDSPEEKSARTGSPGPDENRRRGRTLAAREPEKRDKTQKAMAKQAITLKIAGKNYPFTIESGRKKPTGWPNAR